MFKKILVATDLDDASKDALDAAVVLARNQQAVLHIVHVLLDPLTQPWGADAYGINLPNLLAEMRRDASRALETVVSVTKNTVEDVRSGVLVGSPAAEIVRYATAEGVDLIVVGTHGRGPVPRAFLGSVADRVVREAPCPVLTVRRKPAG
jgi:nucleotide-binding universal stress UspA family protein